MALTLTTLGLAGLLSLTACGGGHAADAVDDSDVAAAADFSDFSDDVFALQAVGLETGLEQAAPAPSASGAVKDKAERRQAARKFLRKNTLHGEITVQGKDGVRTVVVQRGTVSAVDAATLSVKSSDGFTLTWTLGDKVKVVQDKAKVEAGAIKVGGAVGVAGAQDGNVTIARLVAIG
jgi:hypothetical protein